MVKKSCINKLSQTSNLRTSRGGFILKYIVIFLILIIATIQDFRCSKISNILVILGYCVSFIYQVVYEVHFLLWLHGILLPIVILFLLFYLKMLGAGDIKLLSVLGGFIGGKDSLQVFIWALFIGAIWSILKLVYCRNVRERLEYFYQYICYFLQNYSRIPYRTTNANEKSYTIHFSFAILLAYVGYYLVYFMEGGW